MLRMVNLEKKEKATITARKDRHLRGTSNSNRTSIIKQHAFNQTAGSVKTTMESAQMPRHNHSAQYYKTRALRNHVERRDVLTTQQSQGLDVDEPTDTEIEFKTERNAQARNNMPAYRVLTYIIKL